MRNPGGQYSTAFRRPSESNPTGGVTTHRPMLGFGRSLSQTSSFGNGEKEKIYLDLSDVYTRQH